MKISLGDHGNLSELAVVQPQKFCNSLFQLDKEIRGLEEEIQEQDQLLGKAEQRRRLVQELKLRETEERELAPVLEKRAVQLKEAEERTVYCKALDEKIRKGMGQ